MSSNKATTIGHRRPSLCVDTYAANFAGFVRQLCDEERRISMAWRPDRLCSLQWYNQHIDLLVARDVWYTGDAEEVMDLSWLAGLIWATCEWLRTARGDEAQYGSPVPEVPDPRRWAGPEYPRPAPLGTEWLAADWARIQQRNARRRPLTRQSVGRWLLNQLTHQVRYPENARLPHWVEPWFACWRHGEEEAEAEGHRLMRQNAMDPWPDPVAPPPLVGLTVNDPCP